MAESNVLLIDGDNLLKRAYYGCGRREFVPLHAFTSGLLRLMRAHMGGMCVVAWDGGHAHWRRELIPGYKVRAHKPDRAERTAALKTLKSRAMDLLTGFGITQILIEGIEADDIIAYYAKACTRARIFSNDGDFLMLINAHHRVLRPAVKKADQISIGLSNFEQHTGFSTPQHYRMAKALAGDTSDCVAGVPGVGEKISKDIVHTLVPDEISYHAPLRGMEAVLRVCAKHKSKRWNHVSDNPEALDTALRCTDLLSTHLLDGASIRAMASKLTDTVAPVVWIYIAQMFGDWDFPSRLKDNLGKVLEPRPRRLPRDSFSFAFANDPTDKWGT